MTLSGELALEETVDLW